MSYALRNTLILLAVLGILSLSGWGYLHFVQSEEIVALGTQIKSEKQKLRNDSNIADRYESVLKQYVIIQAKLQQFQKVLFPRLNASQVYAYLDKVSRGNAYLNINFTLKDSVKHQKYGYIKTSLVGDGNYRNLYNLIYVLEHSRAINKIQNLVINPVNEVNKYSQVNYSLDLDSYYDRGPESEKVSLSLVNYSGKVKRNPFFPLIRGVKPNDENLPNVEQSKLLAVGNNFVFLVDQDGKIEKLSLGDKVYLGTLNSVNVTRKSALFLLNKGGILDKVTLKVQ